MTVIASPKHSLARAEEIELEIRAALALQVWWPQAFKNANFCRVRVISADGEGGSYVVVARRSDGTLRQAMVSEVPIEAWRAAAKRAMLTDPHLEPYLKAKGIEL